MQSPQQQDSFQNTVEKLRLQNRNQSKTVRQIQELNLKSCRICLVEGNSIEEDFFLSPCQCSGSLKYVHNSCFREWLGNHLKKKQMEGDEFRTFPCQICKYPIKFTAKRITKCNSCEVLKQNISEKKQFFILGIFMQLLCVAVFAYILYQVSVKQIDFEAEEKGIGFYVGIVALIMVPILFGLWLYSFFKHIFLSIEPTVDMIEEIDGQLRKRSISYE